MSLDDIPEPSEEDLQSVRDILQVYCERLEYTDYIRVAAHLIRQGKALASLVDTLRGLYEIDGFSAEEEKAIKTFEEIE